VGNDWGIPSLLPELYLHFPKYARQALSTGILGIKLDVKVSGICACQLDYLAGSKQVKGDCPACVEKKTKEETAGNSTFVTQFLTLIAEPKNCPQNTEMSYWRRRGRKLLVYRLSSFLSLYFRIAFHSKGASNIRRDLNASLSTQSVSLPAISHIAITPPS